MSQHRPSDQNPTAPLPSASTRTTPGPGVVPDFAPPAPGQPRRRYAVAGTGHRAGMYVEALSGEHADVGELVAWLDFNPARIDYYDTQLGHALGADGPAGLPRYTPDHLERMITEQNVDTVIVTSIDRTHAELVDRSLRAGADVIVEKPLTTDAAGCRLITRAVADTGREVVMTFNYRYAPRNSTLRQVIADGTIGDVTSVHFEWVLDTMHGADYFRRWHREKHNSGGLLVHKASHHFDLVNWWIDDVPTRVYASGALRFYGSDNAAARGMGPRPERGTGTHGDPFSLDLRGDARLEALYLQAEHHDGYRRDQDPFAPGVTIEDNMSVLVDYARGATLSYSLNAHSPWEGYRVSVNGTRGRAELCVVERSHIDFTGDHLLDPSATPEDTRDDLVRPVEHRLIVQQHWQRAQDIPIPDGIGGHGGGDAILLKDVFRRDLRIGTDALGRAADYLDGVRAVAVGVAANESLRTGHPVHVDDLHLGVPLTGGHFAPDTADETPLTPRDTALNSAGSQAPAH
ncbi:Gfo/Idh/MocA family protein [Streptomyces solaniscabiei]|uniref:Gfo/Idh/MocA family protein n=1 Tax=Streptomyces solaniscabiei TaxID=2683255 RepID=UPI001CE2BB2C|nr:Gfo/Idh/MocA family oxidoreductase [Streptomyces solaniscabiei]